MRDALTGDPRQFLLDAPLSRYQATAIGVTVLLCALDGFDVLAATYAAPGFLREWGLSNAELGVALSMGLFGMALGSFFLAPLADTLGRRNMIFCCLALMAVGMGATAFSNSLAQLCFWRVFTGLGIGAMICIINPLAAEYSNSRYRDFSIAMMALGYPIGGTLGGLASAQLLLVYDWRAIFLFGAAVAVLMVPLVMRWMPDPVSFLIQRPGPDALAKVNLFLARCGHGQVSELPPRSAGEDGTPFREIFNAQNRGRTIQITLIYALMMIAIYFFLSWTPKLVADLGFTPATATLVAVTRDVSGIVGGLVLGWFIRHVGLKRVAIVVLVGLGLSIAIFGQLPADIGTLRWAAAVAGLFLYGCAIASYAILARTFTTRMRATGTGFVVGVARIASTIAPLAGGYLFALGWDRGAVTLAMATAAFVAALLLLRFTVLPITAE